MASNYFQQTTGTRIGQYYHLIQENGRDIRVYDDGTRVDAGPIGHAAATPPTPAAPTAPVNGNGQATTGTAAVVPGQPSIAPFATAQDQIGLAGAVQTAGLQSAQINQGVTDLAATTAYQKAQNDKTALRNSTDEKDVAASHGLFQSSIKDGALADIEAQRTIQNNFLDDALGRATSAAQTQTGILGTGLNSYTDAYHQQMAQNAQGIADTIAPAATPAATPAAPHAPGTPETTAQHPNVGDAQPSTGVAPHAPASGYSFVQSTGTRQGMSYNVIQHGTQNIRVYSNGDRVPIP